MLAVAGLALPLSLPILPTGPAEAAAGLQDRPLVAQVLDVPDTGQQPVPVARDGYLVIQAVPGGLEPYARTADTFVSDPASAVQWPFRVGVPVSSGFGYRVPPCGSCSSYHRGVDLTPGIGTPIQAMADGVVTVATSDGTYGEYVVIEHLIDGQRVESLYAHMLSGSTAVQVGQQVKVGELVGLVGNTGLSTGAHLHFEVRPDGVPVDPFVWLPPRVRS
ncbi:MAG: hypothetical protein CMF57_09115 [Leifsonia sp.]|jgi:murein DD-endopeptidase MepM/ murein hydrolase activator NlpD|nr:hypothetical protein [Leifsonia sp.]